MAFLPPNVAAFTAAHDGVVTRGDLLGELACSVAEVDGWLRAGVLEAAYGATYRVRGSPPTPRQRLRLAVVRAGPGARAGGVSACGLHGLEGFDLADRPWVVVPPHRRVRGVDFTVVRMPVPDAQAFVIDDIPTVRVPLALIDAAGQVPEKSTRVGVDDARRKGLIRMDRLWELATELGRRPGAVALRRIFRSGVLDNESEGERTLDRLWQPGDPRPRPQVWVVWRGRRYRLDFAFCEARLALEYDSARWHTIATDRQRDGDRDLALAELDIQTLRITKAMLADPAGTRRRILAVREQRLALGLPPIVDARPR